MTMIHNLRSVIAQVLRVMNRIPIVGRRAAKAIESKLPRRLARHGIEQASRGGAVWELDLSDNLQRAAYFRGALAVDALGELCHLVPERGFFLDVGANVGTVSIPLALSRPDLHVHALEPASDTFERLQRNIALNQLEDRFTSHQVGAGSSNRIVTLKSSKKYGEAGRSARSLHGDGSAVEAVKIVTLDDLLIQLGWPPIVGMKIDVEGHELEALNGATALLSSSEAPAVIILEIVPELLKRAGASWQAIRDFMKDNGYRPVAVRSGELVLADPPPRRDVAFIK